MVRLGNGHAAGRAAAADGGPVAVVASGLVAVLVEGDRVPIGSRSAPVLRHLAVPAGGDQAWRRSRRVPRRGGYPGGRGAVAGAVVRPHLEGVHRAVGQADDNPGAGRARVVAPPAVVVTGGLVAVLVAVNRGPAVGSGRAPAQPYTATGGAGGRLDVRRRTGGGGDDSGGGWRGAHLGCRAAAGGVPRAHLEGVGACRWSGWGRSRCGPSRRR